MGYIIKPEYMSEETKEGMRRQATEASLKRLKEMREEVKTVRIRSQVHIISHHVMSGYKTLCGKTASFGHQVHRLKVGEITCQECVRAIKR